MANLTPQQIADELKAQLDIEREARKRAEDNALAIAQEFNQVSSVEQAQKLTLDKIAELVPKALTRIEYLMSNSSSDAVQANLSKWAVDAVLSGKLDKDSGSELGKLMKKLAENDKPKPSGPKTPDFLTKEIAKRKGTMASEPALVRKHETDGA